MSYRLVAANGRYDIELQDEPESCRALSIHDKGDARKLRQGTWLALFVAAWSGPDLEQVRVAIDVACRLADLNLAIVPFDEHHEIRAWCPEVTEDAASPIWVVLLDAHVVAQRVGAFQKRALKRWLEHSAFSRDEEPSSTARKRA